MLKENGNVLGCLGEIWGPWEVKSIQWMQVGPNRDLSAIFIMK